VSRRKTVLTFDRAVDRFLAYMQDQRGATKRTIDSYARVLGYTRDVLGREADPLGVDEDDLLDVLATWRSVSSSTRANRISVLRSFFSWLAQRYDCENPAAGLERPRKEKRARRRLQSDDVARLLATARSDRDRLVVWLLAMTGMRRSELIGLRGSQVDTEHRVIRPYGKGEKGREIPLPVPLAVFLADLRAKLSEHGQAQSEHYVACRRREFSDAGPGSTRRRAYLYPSQPMGHSTPEKILHRIARAARVDDAAHVSPHDLRRAYALIFLSANPHDIYRLQSVLGHADVGTTRIYLPDADFGKTQEAVDRIEFGAPLVTGDERREAASGEAPAGGRKERMMGLEPTHEHDPAGSRQGDEPASPLVTEREEPA
jgi:integrase/recombinase XerD